MTDPYIGRISIRPNDSGYGAYSSVRSQGYRPHIEFNGEQAIGVITADSAAGMIVRLKCDAAGKFIYDKTRQAFEDEVVHGKVEIEFHPEAML